MSVLCTLNELRPFQPCLKIPRRHNRTNIKRGSHWSIQNSHIRKTVIMYLEQVLCMLRICRYTATPVRTSPPPQRGTLNCPHTPSPFRIQHCHCTPRRVLRWNSWTSSRTDWTVRASAPPCTPLQGRGGACLPNESLSNFLLVSSWITPYARVTITLPCVFVAAIYWIGVWGSNLGASHVHFQKPFLRRNQLCDACWYNCPRTYRGQSQWVELCVTARWFAGCRE